MNYKMNYRKVLLKKNLKKENGKKIEQQIMKPKVQCQQNQIDSQNNKNQMAIEVMSALYVETKLLKTVNFQIK